MEDNKSKKPKNYYMMYGMAFGMCIATLLGMIFNQIAYVCKSRDIRSTKEISNH